MTEGDRILPFPGRRAPGETSDAPAIPTLPEPAPTLEGVVLLRGGRRLLDGLTLRLPGHGITALMGPNGAGKSLSLRVMAGLVRPDLGQVRSIAIATSLVFQRPVLLRTADKLVVVVLKRCALLRHPQRLRAPTSRRAVGSEPRGRKWDDKGRCGGRWQPGRLGAPRG